MKPRRPSRPAGSKPTPRSRPKSAGRAKGGPGQGAGPEANLRPFGGHPGTPPSARPGYKPRPVDRRPAPFPAHLDGGSRRGGGPAPGQAGRRGPAAPPIEERTVAHVVPAETLAKETITIARNVEKAVLEDERRADRALSYALRFRRDLALPDHRFVSRAVFALFRWRGWVEPLQEERIEKRLLLSCLLDFSAVHPICRIWAKMLGMDPGRLMALGDAPNWTAKGEGWKRINEGRPVTADPWRLFPTWLKPHLPLPPGGGSPKTKYLELLQTLQTRPSLWVRAQGADPAATWKELNDTGIKPWVHRKLTRAAKIDSEADVHHLPAFERGDLEIQDLASQAVALACDPDPGERWWDACTGAGGKALHLAALMGGKGLVVATDVHEAKLKETVRRARRSPFRNITTKAWDGKHVVGKAGKYDGVLVDAPCSAIGTWRRNPDARWTLDPAAVERLAATQAQALRAAAAGVRPGGTLVYAVCTMTLAETVHVVKAFLAERPEYRLDPFPHPITGEATDGTLQIWPYEADTDAMFVARMVRTG